MSISVVIPLYCEADGLVGNLRAIATVLESVQLPFEFILVDDGSPDDTWTAIERLAQEMPNVRAMRLSRNFGKEAALCAGLENATGEAVIVMDADLQHPPALIPEMIRVWQRSAADVVEAVKESRGRESLFHRLASRLFYSLFTRASGFDIAGASDFKLMSRRAVQAWLRMPERNVFFRGMSAWVGFRRTQIPFSVGNRSGGRSGWSIRKLARLATGAITAFSSAPLQLITVAGVAFAIFATAIAARTLYLWFIGEAVSGFSTVILVLLIIGCLLMFGIGIIGAYVARIYDEVKMRPRYIVEQTLRLDK
jgi:glycosyltransferase involved in cell wall biosynthesis